MSMKFLFVHNWQGFSLAEWYLREAISSHCNVSVSFRSLDLPSCGIPANDFLPRIISTWKPDVVGFSCHYWSFFSFIEAASWVKHLNPEARIILGGPQVNSIDMAQSILSKYQDVDFIIRGSGEEPICRLMEGIAGNQKFEKIPGLSYRTPELIQHNSSSSGSPWKRSLIFSRENKELTDQLYPLSEVSYETVLGCRSRCLYCVYPTSKFEFVDDDMVQSELSFLCDLGIQHIRICDSHFGGSKERAKKILHRLRKVNRRSSIKIYPDLMHIDPEYVELIQDAGAEVTSIGIQTTNRKSLKMIRRQAMHDYQEAIELILNEFPNVPVDLIVGLPGDNLEGLKQTFRDVLDMGFSTVNIFRLAVFPGTPLAKDESTYFGGDAVVHTSHGQVLSSPVFPSGIQKEVVDLIHALEIASPLVRTRECLSRSSSSLNLMDSISQLDSESLLEVWMSVASFNPAKLRSRFDEVIEKIAKIIGDRPEIRNALKLDLDDQLQQNKIMGRPVNIITQI